MPAQHYAAIASLFICVFYAYLAGFSLPTQRALIMVIVALSAILIYKPIFNLHALCVALLLVLLITPHSVLLTSFWFSFSAVGFIYLALQLCSQMSSIKKYLFVQVYLSIALLPLSCYVFHEGSLISPLANLFAIPLVTFVVLPSLLLIQCLLVLDMNITIYVLTICDYLLMYLLNFFSILAAFEFSTFNYMPSLFEILVYESALVTLSIKNSWTKYSFAIVLLPLLFVLRPLIPSIHKDGLRLTILDVGQGLSVLIELNTSTYLGSERRTLLYDTGLASASGFNMGDAVIKPYMQTRKIQYLDKVIISHNDNDHIGGLESLLSDTLIKTIMFSQLPVNLNFSQNSASRLENHSIAPKIEFCHDNHQWEWGEVKFQIYHPPLNWYSKENDRSCVLKIDYFEHSIMLPGDIHESVERKLVKQHGVDLKSEILLAPHHGSQTSSSLSFIDYVEPLYVIFSTGIHNRYRHPHPQIIDRYLKQHIHILNTASDGAISFQLFPNKAIQWPTSYQQQSKRYWHSSREQL